MAVKLGDALLMLGADDDQLKKDLDGAEKKTSGWASTVSGVLAGFGMGIFNAISGAIGSAFDTIGESITLASDLAETTSKVRTLFGESAADIEAWASGAASNLGMTKQAALDAVGTIGNLFLQLGESSESAGQMSQSLVQLATDLGSFHNADPTEILDSMSAAFRGEYDSLQKYVPMINAANVEQRALKDTGKAAASELTALDKATAAYQLTIEGAGAATGDFARTSDGWANTMKTLNAYWEEFKTLLGETLLPILTPIIGKVKDLAETYLPMLANYIHEHVIPAIEAWGAGFDGWWAAHAQPFLDDVTQMWTDFVGKVESAMGDTESEFGANTETMKATARVIGAEIGEALGSSIGGGVKTAWDAWWEEYWAGVKQRMEADPILGPFLRWKNSMNPNPTPATPSSSSGGGGGGFGGGAQAPTYQTTIPITINAQGASANAVERAAYSGVTQAMRAAGVTP